MFFSLHTIWKTVLNHDGAAIVARAAHIRTNLNGHCASRHGSASDSVRLEAHWTTEETIVLVETLHETFQVKVVSSTDLHNGVFTSVHGVQADWAIVSELLALMFVESDICSDVLEHCLELLR